MKIDISSILYEEGRTVEIDKELDFSNVSFDNIKFISPVKVKGKFLNLGGCIEFNAEVKFQISYLCDRCLSESKKEVCFDFSERFKKSLDIEDENSDTIYFSGNEIDIFEPTLNNIYLNIPVKLICDEECKGLCPICGKDLNNGECGCDTEITDPRFDVLDNFFK